MIRLKLTLVFAALLALTFGVAGVSADTGGPDDGGYSFIDSHEANGPAFDFIDISGSGTLAAGLHDQDDEVQEDVPIGFDFIFYGMSFSTVNISSNGVLEFEESNDEYENIGIPNDPDEAEDADSDPMTGRTIFPWWDDLDPSECGDVYFETTGSAPERRFIVQWNVCHNDEPSSDIACAIDFEAILFEGSNEILTQYSDTTFGDQDCLDAQQEAQSSNIVSGKPAGNAIVSDQVTAVLSHEADGGASASIGIQRDEDVGLEYEFDGSREITDGLAICFFAGRSNSHCGAQKASQNQRPAPPNIGGLLAPLILNGQPTPLPTAIAPASQRNVIISPPNTGDAGLADSSNDSLVYILGGIIGLSLAGLAGLRLRWE